MKDNDIVIVDAKRTAIGNFLGSLSKLSATDLGSIVINSILKENPQVKNIVTEVIVGNVLTASLGQNPARITALKSGLDKSIPAFTINQVCGSGLKAVELAYLKLLHDKDAIIIAGGQENMSQSPHLMPKIREVHKYGSVTMLDSMLHDGLFDAFNNCHMGVTAENIAKKFNISRERQDAYAINSQKKALKAQSSNKFSEEIISIPISLKNDKIIIFNKDEFIKENTSLDLLAKLKPAFSDLGTVTSGNSSGINDGAAFVLLMTYKKAKELLLNPLAIIRGVEVVGIEPEFMGLGPIKAINNLLKKINWQLESIDAFEINEAFAVQVLKVQEELEINDDRLNVNGGSIALGHPIGASGCRILVTLLHEMKRSKLNRGVASLCIGGGMGIAIALERE